MSFPLKIATLHGAIWTSHLICNSFSPCKPITQMAYWLVQLFLHSSPQSVPILYNGPLPSPLKIAPSHGGSGPHLIHGSLSPPEPTTQIASRSIQPFLQGSQLWQTDRQTDYGWAQWYTYALIWAVLTVNCWFRLSLDCGLLFVCFLPFCSCVVYGRPI